ncbi:MAG TPA: metallophosphoesterase [Bradyrhizobium sp.]|nr:metallophosphoesterase [Bradyrhizobium sp.]
MATNIVGPNGRLYADPKPGPDATKFSENNTSSAYYSSPYFLAHKNQVQPIPRRRNNQPVNLADFLPPEIVTAIENAGKISFHAVGDTGAAKVNRAQTAATAIGHETAVADAMVRDTQAPELAGPAFFFHLGDVIYNFGEAQYYYDQFYEPFREYDRPIFAIPGNHDGMVFGQGSSAPQVPTLDAFLTNFCASEPGPSPDAGGLSRSVMNQPGVYFTLDAPFVSIIGLYSNVLDSGPGVISSQGGHFPLVDDQLDFMTSELQRLKPRRIANERAVIIAVHHPPLSADAKHGGSLGIMKDIDSCCNKAGLFPDALLCGHAHLYQRFTRVMKGGKEIPYIVAGSGGFAATAPKQIAKVPVTVGDHTLVVAPIPEFGYLTAETNGRTLSFVFKTANQAGVVARDTVVVDLNADRILAPGQVAVSSAGRGGSGGRAAGARRPVKKAKKAGKARKAGKAQRGRK